MYCSDLDEAQRAIEAADGLNLALAGQRLKFAQQSVAGVSESAAEMTRNQCAFINNKIMALCFQLQESCSALQGK